MTRERTRDRVAAPASPALDPLSAPEFHAEARRYGARRRGALLSGSKSVHPCTDSLHPRLPKRIFGLASTRASRRGLSGSPLRLRGPPRLRVTSRCATDRITAQPWRAPMIPPRVSRGSAERTTDGGVERW